jgi:[ribosomal protein S5]-alanine N-acetyltransferase
MRWMVSTWSRHSSVSPRRSARPVRSCRISDPLPKRPYVGDHQLPETIETERLRLRSWRLGDVDDVFAYAQDAEWSRYLHMLPAPYVRRHAEEFVARQLLLNRDEHVAWVIEVDGVAVGGLNLRFFFGHRIAELGYSIARQYWNRGYVSEAASAAVAATFRTYPDLHRVRAFADLRNTASQRVMEKLGMIKEGVLRQNRVERGEPFDEAWYGLLRSEWEAIADGADR